MFEKVIGQTKTKRRLEFYFRGFRATNRIPHLLFIASRGQGKSFLARTFGDLLGKKIYEFNSAVFKKPEDFFAEVIQSNLTQKNVTVFFDEASELPLPLQMVLLSILEPNDKHKNMVRHEGVEYTFDFHKISFLLATTEPNKMFHALLNRLTEVNLQAFNDKDLVQILEQSLNEKDVSMVEKVKSIIPNYLRGDARSVTLIADDIERHCLSNKSSILTENLWRKYIDIMSIKRYGLLENEMNILLALRDNGPMTLTHLAASLDFSRQALKNSVELYLMKRNLIKIGNQSKRELTKKGFDLLKETSVL